VINTRVIPCLLLKGLGLVKTVRFKGPKYVGDPINAVKIFNEKEVDELIFLDIDASVNNRVPNFDLISRIASECFMPLSYGGGLKCFDDIKKILGIGVEKVVLNSSATSNSDLIKNVSEFFGSQSIVVSIDVKKSARGEYKVYTHGGRVNTSLDAVEHAARMAERGAGELFLNSIDRDGTMEGYDIELIKKITNAVNIPVVACGGAGKVSDFADAVHRGGASAVSAGSMFVFYGKSRAVLINFPTREELRRYLP